MNAFPKEEVLEIVGRHAGKPGSLAVILREIHDKFGYIPTEAIETVSPALHLSPRDIRSVIAYRRQWRMAPPGMSDVRLCRNDSCRERGSDQLIEFIEGDLGVKIGAPKDGDTFCVNEVFCMGACDRGPSVMVDGDVHAPVSPDRFIELTRKP